MVSCILVSRGVAKAIYIEREKTMHNKFEKITLYTAIADYGKGTQSALDMIVELISDDPDNRIAMNELVVLDWQVEDMELIAKEKTAIEKLMAMDNVVDIVIDKQGG